MKTNMFKNTGKNLIQSAFSKIGLRLVRISNGKIRPGINLNVGCGNYEISGFISVDFYSEHYYQSGNFKRTHYDM